MLGHVLDAAGGRNIASGMVPGAYGTLSLEYLLSHPPEVYIGTAIGASDSVARTPNLIVLGAGVDARTARDSLVRATQRRGIGHLPTFKQGRVYGIWHHFYTSPFNVVAVQAMAKWLHPALFADLDPQATLQMLYQRFQPVPLDGVYWVSLNARYGQHVRQRLRRLVALLALLLVLVATDLATGPSGMPLQVLWQGLWNADSLELGQRVILWEVRLPYAVMAVLVGASLGLAGAEMQT
eukprot:gene30625-52800_t